MPTTRGWLAVAGVLGAMALTGCTPARPAPAEPTPITRQLPQSADMEWNKAGDWRQVDTRDSPASVCLTEPVEAGDDLLGIGRRDFVLKAHKASHASVTVLEYATPTAADAAYATMRSDNADCAHALSRSGARDGKQYPVRGVAVPAGAVAEMAEFSFTTGKEKYFESLAVVLDGTRVAYVVMKVQTDESYWSFPGEQQEWDMHPLLRTLPHVVNRMRLA